MKSEDTLGKRVEICFDYLSCSFPFTELESFYKNIIRDRPILLDYGFRGYKSSGTLVGKGRVAWSEERKEAHVDLPSQALQYYTSGELVHVLDLVKWVYAVGGKLSRLDVAYDDKEGIVTVAQVEEAVRNNDWVSRARHSRVNESLERLDDDTVSMGKTVYIGSKSSQICLRVYDKAKQLHLEGQHWTRFEMVLRDEASNAVVNDLIAAHTQGLDIFSNTAIGLLRGYCDFRDFRSDTNATRRVLLPWWREFIQCAEKLRIVRQKVTRTIAKVYDWIERQVAPNLAVLKAYYGASFPGLMQYVTIKGKERWRSVHEALLADGVKLATVTG